MIYVLDTNVLIYLIKNQPPADAQRVDALPADARLCMSFVTLVELLKGAERSTTKPEVLRRREASVRQLAVLFPAGPAIGEHHAKQFSRLKDASTPIGANDLWIACHALAESAALVTHNTREFQRVGGLRVEDWVAPDGQSWPLLRCSSWKARRGQRPSRGPARRVLIRSRAGVPALGWPTPPSPRCLRDPERP